jgi:tripartite-type tricarboxylate transporter receptor subunit TctC
VVDNRPGAGGNIGADIVAKSPPDGYTIVMGRAVDARGQSQPLRQDAVRRGQGFRADLARRDHPERARRQRVAAGQLAKEFIAYAKRIPASSRSARAATAAPDISPASLFKVDTGDRHRHVPYKGGAPATQALLAGDTQFMFDNLANAMPQVQGGQA